MLSLLRYFALYWVDLNSRFFCAELSGPFSLANIIIILEKYNIIEPLILRFFLELLSWLCCSTLLWAPAARKISIFLILFGKRYY